MFRLRKTFYPFPVYEINLPAGHTCPFAKDCKVLVDRYTGKFDVVGKKFRCYASSAERFPSVRNHRWDNFERLKNGEPIIIPDTATHIRIHGSGDFFSQEYFDSWLSVCKNNPKVKFWAFTKSIQYWVNRIDLIPDNLELTASKGSMQDELIDRYNLNYAEVFQSEEEVPPHMPIDYDDSLAMAGECSFALIDNNKRRMVK